MNSTTNQPNLLELAKQGNAKAIATLMNRQLQPKGITAKAVLKEGCLQIMLESAQVPNQQALVAFVRKGITSLEAAPIERVKVYGRKTGEEFPVWYQDFDIVAPTVPNFVDLAKQGDVEAITTLICQWLQPQSLTVKVSLRDNYLQVMLESAQVPDEQVAVSRIRDGIIGLGIRFIRKLKIYGRQIGEEFPDWYQELSWAALEQPSSSAPRANVEFQPSVATTETEKAASPSTLKPEIDITEISNDIYETLHNIFYLPISLRIKAEDEQESVFEVVKAFNIEQLENEIKLALNEVYQKLIRSIKDIVPKYEIQDLNTVITNICTSSGMLSLRAAIKRLKSITEEVLVYNFPQESGNIANIFKRGTQVITSGAGLDGLISKEVQVGVAIGSLFAPGLGTVIGGAVGSWLATDRQKREVQELVERYNAAQENLIKEYDKIWKITYQTVSEIWYNGCGINLKTYQQFHEDFEQYCKHYEDAINSYKKNKFYLCTLDIQKANQIFPTKEHPYRLALNLQTETEYVEVLLFLGNIYLGVRQIDVAENIFNKLLATDFYSADAAYSLARIFSVKNDQDRALDYLEQAFASGFSNFDALETDKELDGIRHCSRYHKLVSTAIDLVSEVGVDYTKLRDLLAAEKWKEADRETWNVMCRALGKPIGSYFNISDLENFPCQDLQTIDKLWVKYSAGQFGFSVQKEIYEMLGKNLEYFKKYVGWPESILQDYSPTQTFSKLDSRGSLPCLCNLKGMIFFIPNQIVLSEIISRMSQCKIV